MIEKIKGMKPLVTQFLEDFPETRDNDNLLLLKVWSKQNPKLKDKGYTFGEFAVGLLLEETYANFESVRRARQKVQEENEHLRGNNYRGRKDAAEEVRQGI